MKDSMIVAGVEISNPNRIVYPSANIKKIDLAMYYEKVAPLMLPFLEKRLLSVVRCHDDVLGERFFKKHPTTEGDHVQNFFVGDEEYFYVKNKAEIVFQVQMGTLEFHTWGCKISSIEKPDIMVFDLDPSEDVSLDTLRDGVRKLKSVLDELNLKSFLKTSGGKGYHVVVPFSKAKDWNSFADFSKQVALLLEARWPNLFTSNIRKQQRTGKIFVDYLRNKKGATCVAPYSLRAREGAPISLPISWQALDKVAPNEVNIKNFSRYVKDKDPWANFFDERQILK